MVRLTQREIKDMVLSNHAEDVTHATQGDYRAIINKEGWLRQIGYSCGKYGCNGMLLHGHNTGKLYAVTSRTTAIYLFG